MATIAVRRLCRNPIRMYIRSLSTSTRIETRWMSSNVSRFNNSKLLRQQEKCMLSSSYTVCRYATEKKEKALDEKKLSLFQKFKQMYRDYWYVLVPVHIVTSIGWFGGFYYLAKSGIDIVSIMESWHISETLISPLRDSSMGYLAVSYALYKLATPFRYMVTLGGTTFAINYLKNLGYIKPVPSAEELKVMYKRSRSSFMRRPGHRLKTDESLKERESMVTGLHKKVKLRFDKEGKTRTKKKDELCPGDVDSSKEVKIKSTSSDSNVKKDGS